MWGALVAKGTNEAIRGLGLSLPPTHPSLEGLEVESVASDTYKTKPPRKRKGTGFGELLGWCHVDTGGE